MWDGLRKYHSLRIFEGRVFLIKAQSAIGFRIFFSHNSMSHINNLPLKMKAFYYSLENHLHLCNISCNHPNNPKVDCITIIIFNFNYCNFAII